MLWTWYIADTRCRLANLVTVITSVAMSFVEINCQAEKIVLCSSCCLVIFLIETRGFWKSCTLNNLRAGAMKHPITDASRLQPIKETSTRSSWVVILLWRKPCFVCSCLVFAWLHNCAFLSYFKASRGIWSPLPLTAVKATACHSTNESCRHSEAPLRQLDQRRCTG